jgi:hypothetical protein
MSDKQAIFLAACQQVAQACADNGFRFVKSRKALERLHAPFDERITFTSSMSINRLPEHIHFEVRALAANQISATQQRDHRSPFGGKGIIGATTIENLFRVPPPYIKYDLGDPATRDQIIEHVITVIKRDVFRFFELARDPIALCDALAIAPIPALSNPGVLVEYYLCFTDTPTTRRYLRATETMWPGLNALIVEYLTRMRTEGMPEGGYADAWGTPVRVAAMRAAQALFHHGVELVR